MLDGVSGDDVCLEGTDSRMNCVKVRVVYKSEEAIQVCRDS